MKNTAQFWNKIAPRYAKQPIGDEAAYHHKLDLTRAALSPDAEVLEIGCGTGTTAIAHAPFCRSIRATDFAPDMLAIARERAAAAGVTNVHFEVADATRLNADGNRYDAVLALSLLHLVPDWRALVVEAAKWLKPGGVLVTNTVCIKEMNGILPKLLPLMTLVGMAPKVMKIDTPDLFAAHAAAGLVVEHHHVAPKDRARFLIGRKPVTAHRAVTVIAPEATDA